MSEPHFKDATVTLYAGDCLEILRELPDSSVDSVCCAPPYGLSNTSPQQVADTLVRWVNGDRDYIPTGSGFMGRPWDAFVPPVAVWDECLRVLKPGGHVLAFAGSRTHDLMTLALRLAGFEIRDSVAWLYGSGFPKSLDVSKAIDKARTEDRAPVDAVRSWLNARRLDAGLSHDAVNKHFGHASNGGGSSSAWMTNPTSKSLPTWDQWQTLKALFVFGDEMDAEVWRLNGRKGKPGDNFESREVLSEVVREVKGGSWADNAATGRYSLGEKVIRDTAPATPDAEHWQGWGTALKPAFEPIVMGRKPLAGTVAANVLAHGTGALNIDGCRTGYTSDADKASARPGGKATSLNGALAGKAQTCETPSTAAPTKESSTTSETGPALTAPSSLNPRTEFKVEQGAGRWPANVILDESQAAELDLMSGESVSKRSAGRQTPKSGTDAYGEFAGTDNEAGHDDTGGASRFFYVAKADSSERVRVDGIAHPTVKPLSIMRWLVRLVTPPGGTVLEPFAGSGTTVEACILEGFRCIAIEREAEYLPLIQQRIHRRRDPVAAVKATGDDGGLFDLLGEATA